MFGAGAMVAQYGPPPPQPPPYRYAPRAWDAPPLEYREFQQLGFHDGIDGARKDIENHRRPNVNNRDEFRHPHVPREVRGDYRHAFEKGYYTAMQHFANGGPRPY